MAFHLSFVLNLSPPIKTHRAVRDLRRGELLLDLHVSPRPPYFELEPVAGLPSQVHAKLPVLRTVWCQSAGLKLPQVRKSLYRRLKVYLIRRLRPQCSMTHCVLIGMVRPLDKPRKSSSKITSLIRTLSRRKGKAVSDQDESIVLLNLPDAVLENILIQAHPITALALGSTCKHLKAEYTRHRPQISLKLLSQPENHVTIAPASDIKVKSTRKSKTGPATLGAYLVQRSFTYQLVVRNQWSVRSGEVLLHMLLTRQADSEKVWSALLPSLQAEKQMYQDSIDNCVGAEGIDYSRLWDVTVSIRVPVTLSQLEFDALVPCCQPFVARVRAQLAEVTNRDVEDMQLRILFESVNWYRVFRSA